MNSRLDAVLVGLALLASVVYALLALGPRAWRRTALGVLGFKSAAKESQGACGGCDHCGSETPAPKASAEINIPVAKIARRDR